MDNGRVGWLVNHSIGTGAVVLYPPSDTGEPRAYSIPAARALADKMERLGAASLPNAIREAADAAESMIGAASSICDTPDNAARNRDTD